MVTKAKKSGNKKKVKVLNLKKETVRNLRGGEAKKVMGGAQPAKNPIPTRLSEVCSLT